MTDRGTPAVDDRFLADLVRDLSEAVVVADPTGLITFWNRAASRLFGWEAHEAVGNSLDLIIPERLRQRHWDGYLRVMQTGRTDYADRVLEVPALHRDGRTVSIAFTVTLLGSPTEERPAAIAAVIRDDTSRWEERKRLIEEIAELRGRT